MQYVGVSCVHTLSKDIDSILRVQWEMYMYMYIHTYLSAHVHIHILRMQLEIQVHIFHIIVGVRTYLPGHSIISLYSGEVCYAVHVLPI